MNPDNQGVNTAETSARRSVSLAYTLVTVSTLVLCLLASAVYYFDRQSTLKYSETDLEAIADLKAGQITDWLQDIKIDVITQAAHTELSREMISWLQAGAPRDDKYLRRMDWLMVRLKSAYHFDALLILDKDGNIRHSTSTANEPADDKFRQFARLAINSQTPQWYDLTLDASGKPVMGMLMPLRVDDGNGAVVGALFARIDPAVYLYRLIQSWPVLSDTAETLLVRREGDEVLYLNDLRHRRNAALKLRIPIKTVDLPAALVFAGVKGVFYGKDYRGHKVVSYLLPISGTAWAIVAKIDEEEIYRSNRQLAIYLVGGLLILLALQFFALWLYLRAMREREKNQSLTRQYGFLSKYANDMIFLMEPDGRILDANDRALDVYGYTREEMCRMNAREFRADASTENFLRNWQALNDSNAAVFETAHRCKDGSVLQIEASVRKFEAEGKAYVQGILRDITGRKAAESRLRRLSTAVEQSPVSIVITDLAGNIEYVNPKFTEVTGYSPDEVIGENPRMLQSGSLSPAFYKDFWATITSGQIWKSEFFNRRKNGELFWERAVVSPILDAAGAVSGFVAMKEDVTEKKIADQAFRKVSQLYHVLSDVNAAIVRTIDQQLLFNIVCRIIVESGLFKMAWIGSLDAESGAVRIAAQWGDDGDYLSGLNININDPVLGNGPIGRVIRENSFAASDDIENDERMAPWRDKALRNGFKASVAFPLKQAGQVMGVISLYAPDSNFLSEDVLQLLGNLVSDLSYAIDANAASAQRDQAEQQVRELNTELEQRVVDRTLQMEVANKELEAFSYSVSHDLRAPLRSIDGFSQILLNNYRDALDDKGKEYLGRVRRSSQRMGELIDDMLYLSRVSRGEINLGPVDLSAIVHDIARQLQESAPDRKVEWVIQQGMSGQADAKLMRIVLDNLLGNAWKFTSKKPEARIEFGMDEDKCALFVRDNGAGFNMEYTHKLFNPFQRLHGMNDFEGTGIGLATVQRVIHRHGGRVWAEGEEGKGATFYFSCA